MLQRLFSTTDGANAAGLSYLRVPIGASDFSAERKGCSTQAPVVDFFTAGYSLDDDDGDTAFDSFDINNAPSYLFSVINDILSINGGLKVVSLIRSFQPAIYSCTQVHLVPWSPVSGHESRR